MFCKHQARYRVLLYECQLLSQHQFLKTYVFISKCYSGPQHKHIRTLHKTISQCLSTYGLTEGCEGRLESRKS